MKIKDRETPLESFESICNRNGIHFDKSKPYRPLKVICEDGSSFLFDRNCNMFDDFSRVNKCSSMLLEEHSDFCNTAENQITFCQVSVNCTVNEARYDSETMKSSEVSDVFECILNSFISASSHTQKAKVDYQEKAENLFKYPDILSVA